MHEQCDAQFYMAVINIQPLQSPNIFSFKSRSKAHMIEIIEQFLVDLNIATGEHIMENNLKYVVVLS